MQTTQHGLLAKYVAQCKAGTEEWSSNTTATTLIHFARMTSGVRCTAQLEEIRYTHFHNQENYAIALCKSNCTRRNSELHSCNLRCLSL